MSFCRYVVMYFCCFLCMNDRVRTGIPCAVGRIVSFDIETAGRASVILHALMRGKARCVLSGRCGNRRPARDEWNCAHRIRYGCDDVAGLHRSSSIIAARRWAELTV